MKIFAATILTLVTAVRGADPAVPGPVNGTQFSALLERPPFRRVLALSDALVLSGVATLPTGRVVTVWDRGSKQSFLVSPQPNAQGWKLVSLTDSTDLRSISAVIASGDQSITLRFDPDRLTPPKLDNTSRPAAKSESQVVVEALLRSLDSAAAREFEGLPPTEQETFRKSFADFLNTYPAAPDPERIQFVRRTLAELPTEGSGESPDADPANPAADPPSPAPADPPSPAPVPTGK